MQEGLSQAGGYPGIDEIPHVCRAIPKSRDGAGDAGVGCTGPGTRSLWRLRVLPGNLPKHGADRAEDCAIESTAGQPVFWPRLRDETACRCSKPALRCNRAESSRREILLTAERGAF